MSRVTALGFPSEFPWFSVYTILAAVARVADVHSSLSRLVGDRLHIQSLQSIRRDEKQS